jgi:hypothetical protein
MPLSREPFFLRMAIWLRGLERWYLVLGGVAVGRGFEPESDLELSFAKILIGYCSITHMWNLRTGTTATKILKINQLRMRISKGISSQGALGASAA